MIAVDTHVLVRYLVEDDVAQTDRAEAVLRSGAVVVPNTVLLETAWVLRTGYRFDRAAIADGITKLLGLPGVQAEDTAIVGQALDWYGRGLDFADALHLASSRRADAFATFDRALRRKVRAIPGTVPGGRALSRGSWREPLIGLRALRRPVRRHSSHEKGCPARPSALALWRR